VTRHRGEGGPHRPTRFRFRLDAIVSCEANEAPARDELRAAVLRAAGACYGVEPSTSVVQSDMLGSGEIEQRALVTGIGTTTVSTMLTKVAKTGELAKAERGYKLRE
jgi:hypothetical protein